MCIIKKESVVTDSAKQNIINLLKEEGLSEEQIGHIQFFPRTFENPRGLNEIINDVSRISIDTDNWDENIPKNIHIGKLTDNAAKGKQSQIWGMMMQKHAFLYLKKNLQDQGWMLKEGQTIDNKEYDCIGWEGKKSEVNHPDLAIEMYFPLPIKRNLQFPYIIRKTRAMRVKLKLLTAKHKYVLVGVPQNMRISFLEIFHSDMKLIFQRHKFRKFNVVKQAKLRAKYNNK